MSDNARYDYEYIEIGEKRNIKGTRNTYELSYNKGFLVTIETDTKIENKYLDNKNIADFGEDGFVKVIRTYHDGKILVMQGLK